MLGDDLANGIEKDINKLIRDYNNGKVTKNKAVERFNEYNTILKCNLFNGKKRKIKQELSKFKSFLR